MMFWVAHGKKFMGFERSHMYRSIDYLIVFSVVLKMMYVRGEQDLKREAPVDRDDPLVSTFLGDFGMTEAEAGLMAGFDKERLFYTQGDYGLWQCSEPCCDRTWDNEAVVRRTYAGQRNMRVPSELVPRCPNCGRRMAMNLRADRSFVEDEGWHIAAGRYRELLGRVQGRSTLYLELGVGYNIPSIIKYPFWQMTYSNPRARYACVNLGQAYAPAEIREVTVHRRGHQAGAGVHGVNTGSSRS